MTYGTGISNIITDTLVLIVPVPLLLRASLTRRQKCGLAILYLLGGMLNNTMMYFLRHEIYVLTLDSIAFVIVASALRFTTQVLNVSIQQTISWSQIEVSLALILACAPMSAKLLVHPLIDHHFVPLIASPNSDTFSTSYEHRVKYNKELPKLPEDDEEQSYINRNQKLPHVGAMQMNHKEEENVQERGYQSNRWLLPGDRSTILVKDMLSPQRKLKITRVENNGQTIWAVKPSSPPIMTRPLTAMTSRSSLSRSPLSSYAPSNAWPVQLSQRPQ